LAVFEDVSEGLKNVYKEMLMPLEKEYLFHEFHSPLLEDPDFDAKPMVMLVGQYSTGKTTFIRYLLGKDFPGMRIGPEPTTDGFGIVSYAQQDGKIPGNVLVVDPKKPFRNLNQFGSNFLSRFECFNTNSEVLQSISIVDTPGILSGEKQQTSRGYDFTSVLKWFAERVDRIILLFDAHKLDISDEFKRAIEVIKPQEDKIRIALNKADSLNQQQLIRVYGALMWSLAKIFNAPEVLRVYVGSFWDKPLQHDGNRELFEAEQDDLFDDLQGLPRFATVRKLNDIIKRTRLAKVHALIISHLRKEMPMIGKDSKKKQLISHLDEVYVKLQKDHQIPATDFPDIKMMRQKLLEYDFMKFNSFDRKLIDRVDKMLVEEMPKLMTLIPQEEKQMAMDGDHEVKGGAFEKVDVPGGTGIREGIGEQDWIVERTRQKYDEAFASLPQVNGSITGNVARTEMVKSKLPNKELGKIWNLSDIDKDGMFDSDEFALAMYLINLKLEGEEMPAELPKHLIPPSKRSGFNLFS